MASASLTPRVRRLATPPERDLHPPRGRVRPRRPAAALRPRRRRPPLGRRPDRPRRRRAPGGHGSPQRRDDRRPVPGHRSPGRAARTTGGHRARRLGCPVRAEHPLAPKQCPPSPRRCLRAPSAFRRAQRSGGTMAKGKKRTTMAKLNRETRLREKRFEKEMRKEARKQAAADGTPLPAETPFPDETPQRDETGEP